MASNADGKVIDFKLEKKKVDEEYKKSTKKIENAEAHLKWMAIVFSIVLIIFFLFYIKNIHVRIYNGFANYKQEQAAESFEQIMAGNDKAFKTFDAAKVKPQKRTFRGKEKIFGFIPLGEKAVDESSKEVLKKLEEVNKKREEYIEDWNKTTRENAESESAKKATLLYYHTGFIVPFGVMGFYPDHWNIKDPVKRNMMMTHPIGKIEGDMAAKIRNEQNIYPPIFDAAFIPWPEDEDIVNGKLTAFKALNMELTSSITRLQPRYIIALDSSIMYVQIKRERLIGQIPTNPGITYHDMELKYGIKFYKERAEWYYKKINLTLPEQQVDFKKFTASDFDERLIEAVQPSDSTNIVRTIVYGDKPASLLIAGYLGPFYGAALARLIPQGVGGYKIYKPLNIADRDAVNPPIEITYNDITLDLNLFSIRNTYDTKQWTITKAIIGKTEQVERSFAQVNEVDATSKFLVEKIPIETINNDGITGVITKFTPEDTRSTHRNAQKIAWGLDFSQNKYGTCSTPVPMNFHDPVRIGAPITNVDMHYNLIPFVDDPLKSIYYTISNHIIKSQVTNLNKMNANRYLAKEIDSTDETLKYIIYSFSGTTLSFEKTKGVTISNGGTKFDYFSFPK